MRRGGLTRLVQHLGIILVILELSHVPLPAPAHVLRSAGGRAADACVNPDHAPLHWRWAPLLDDPEEEGDEDEVAILRADGDEPGGCQAAAHACAVATPGRARLHHHFVRGHSKGLPKVFADRSAFLARADDRDAGPRPAAIDVSRAPRAAMLQRWRC